MHEMKRATIKMPHRHNYNVSVFYTRFPIFMSRNEKRRKIKNVLNKFEADIKLLAFLSLSFSGKFMPIDFYWHIPFVCPFSSFWSFKCAVVSLHFILALIHINIVRRSSLHSIFISAYIFFFSLFLFYLCCCCVFFFLLHSDFWFNFKHFILVHHAIRQLTNGFSVAFSLELRKPFCHLARV